MPIKKSLIEYLSEIITPHKKTLFSKIIEERTRYITLILEDLFQAHNASAVLRSADCFGIQDVHIIENQNEYKLNPDIALGSSKWLNVKQYNKQENNTLYTIKKLKAEGYRIVATTPHTEDVNLENFDISKGKFALLFGSELPGLSKIALKNADEFIKIPMYGFTESFNISVSAAITLHHLVWKLHQSSINWQLEEEEKLDIQLEWLRRSIKKSELIEAKFYETVKNSKNTK